jgi:cell division protein FtsQ
VPKRRQHTPWQVAAVFLEEHFRSITGVVLAGLLVATVMLGVQWLQDPYRFPLSVIKVDGDYRHLDRERLQSVVAPFVEGGFFGVDVASLCREVEQLPWVYKASVARSWPDGLTLRIEEQEPVARWGEHGYLNRRGEAFYPEGKQVLGHRPLMSGPAGHELAILEKYRRISTTLAPLGLTVTHVHLDERRAWRLEMDSGVRLELGRSDTWPRLQRFVLAWPMIFAARSDELRRVDLRYSNGFSVFWQQAETPAANRKSQRG